MFPLSRLICKNIFPVQVSIDFFTCSCVFVHPSLFSFDHFSDVLVCFFQPFLFFSVYIYIFFNLLSSLLSPFISYFVSYVLCIYLSYMTRIFSTACTCICVPFLCSLACPIIVFVSAVVCSCSYVIFRALFESNKQIKSKSR